MLFGTYLGAFWIAKFILFPLGLSAPFILLLFLGLTLYVPFLGFRYTRRYRDQVLGGSISFLHAWTFTLQMYLFAALITSVAHFFYFRFIDHGFMFHTYETLLHEVTATPIPGAEEYIQQLETNLKLMKGLTPIDITFQLIMQNIFYGSLLAFPTALFAMRKTSHSTPES